MHFVTGGTFNGKREWVIQTYRLNNRKYWISAYDDQSIPNNLNQFRDQNVVLEGIEKWIKELTMHQSIKECRGIWNDRLSEWLKWEQGGEHRTLILIGNDITKGIIPLEEEDRTWRDVTGWCYQDTASKAAKMDVIWYGINQKVK